eukprot:1058723-Rhodomonas_salina.1
MANLESGFPVEAMSYKNQNSCSSASKSPLKGMTSLAKGVEPVQGQAGQCASEQSQMDKVEVSSVYWSTLTQRQG